MTCEEYVNRKLIKAARELTRELDAEMRHDMIGARIYYEDREAGERWLRMESQKYKPESITPGESVLIENRCENPAEVSDNSPKEADA